MSSKIVVAQPHVQTEMEVHPGAQRVTVRLRWDDDDGGAISSSSTVTQLSSDGKVILEQTRPATAGVGSGAGSQAAAAAAAPPAVDFTKPNNPISRDAIEATFGSETQSRQSGGTAGILPAERATASFDVTRMTNYLDGGEEGTKRRHFILQPTSGIDMSGRYSWERERLLREHVKHHMMVHSEFWDNFIPTADDVGYMSDNAMLHGSMAVPYGLVLPTIQGQGSDEQQMWWLFKVVQCQMVVVYAQTELGHGSNVRGLRTFATYDKNTKEFVLHTPTLQATKWWISGMGKVATHALVYAQLILDGKNYGIHIFMTQLRDENHRPLPGIEIGDCGNKLGENANDTGFLRLNQVRVPREHMMSRWQEVTEDGQYVKSEKKTNPKVHYATMLVARMGMIRISAGYLARAVTTAIRYSCVRHQGFKDTSTDKFDAAEMAIIDYQMQRYRLFRQLATTYAFKTVGIWAKQRMGMLQSLENLDGLAELAGTSMGLKGVTTLMCSNGMEDLRKCCGGHGYLLSSGIAYDSADYVFQVTAEGDTMLMQLQTARFLIKSLRAAKEGQTVSGPCDYMTAAKDPKFDFRKVQVPKVSSAKDLDVNFLLTAHKMRALVAISLASEDLESKLSKGIPFDRAWNSCAMLLTTACRAHCLSLITHLFADSLASVPDEKCRAALTRLCLVFGFGNILEEKWYHLIDGATEELVRRTLFELLDVLRPDAVALVDAFDIPDRVLNTPLGRYDGNVYEWLFELAKQSPLNQRDPFDGYEQHLKPYLSQDVLKLHNQLLPEAIESKL